MLANEANEHSNAVEVDLAPQRINSKIALIPQREGIEVGEGATKRVVDPEEVFKLAKLMCSHEEMSDFLGITRPTLIRHFLQEINRGRSETKQALRRAQISLALNGDGKLLQFLGKHYLGQSDNPAIDTPDTTGVVFEVNVVKGAEVVVAQVASDDTVCDSTEQKAA